MTQVKKLGDLLKEEGIIDDFQLEAALSHQRNWGGKLGSILVELEFAREADIARIISEKLKIPYVNLFEPELPQESLKLLKPDVAKKYHVLPLKKEGNSLELVMSDPLDIETMDNIRFITGLKIKPMFAMPSEIRDAIRKYYDGEQIVRAGKDTFRESAMKSSTLEIVREVPDIAKSAETQQQLELQAVRQDLAVQKMLIDALTTLLIEKEFFTRDELAKFMELKKMGL